MSEGNGYGNGIACDAPWTRLAKVNGKWKYEWRLESPILIPTEWFVGSYPMRPLAMSVMPYPSAVILGGILKPSDNALLFALVYLRWVFKNRQTFYVTEDELCVRAGMCPSTMRKARQRLVRLNLLRFRSGTRHRANEYDLSPILTWVVRDGEHPATFVNTPFPIHERFVQVMRWRQGLLRLTEAEKRFKEILETLHIIYTSQHVFFLNDRTAFIADFYIPQARIIIEIDEPFHARQRSYDSWRTNLLSKHGLRVVRIDHNFSEKDALNVLKPLVAGRWRR